MSKRKNRCAVHCLFAIRKRCVCVCQGLNHGKWPSPLVPGSRSVEDRATVETDLSAMETLDRVSQGEGHE